MTLALFGGTFDPPHYGHLNIAKAVQNAFLFDRFNVIPCKIPHFKNKPSTTSKQRLEMLNLLLKSNPEFIIDSREIDRESPSYTTLTLHSFRQQYGKEVSICLLLGIDAFMELPKWYHWQEILELSHIVLIDRPGFISSSSSPILQQVLNDHLAAKKEELLKASAGKIYKFDAGKYEISSTHIREQIQQGLFDDQCLPMPLIDYIKKHRLYGYNNFPIT